MASENEWLQEMVEKSSIVADQKDANVLGSNTMALSESSDFSSLFSFSREDVNQAFKKARLHYKKDGLKFLQVPINNELVPVPHAAHHGKMLIVIPKKFGKAHDRNKIRRQIKSIFYQEKLFLVPTESILLVYNSASRYSFSELQGILIEAFRRR